MGGGSDEQFRLWSVSHGGGPSPLCPAGEAVARRPAGGCLGSDGGEAPDGVSFHARCGLGGPLRTAATAEKDTALVIGPAELHTGTTGGSGLRPRSDTVGKKHAHVPALGRPTPAAGARRMWRSHPLSGDGPRSERAGGAQSDAQAHLCRAHGPPAGLTLQTLYRRDSLLA